MIRGHVQGSQVPEYTGFLGSAAFFRAVAVVAALASALLAAPVSAQDTLGNESMSLRVGGGVWSRLIAVNAHVGVGTPYGWAGVAGELSPFDWATLSVGLGVGGRPFDLDTTTFPQVGIVPRLRYVTGHSAIGGGAGVSFGPFDWEVDGQGTAHFDLALWINVEASFEYRSRKGLSLRLYVGGALLASGDPDSVACVDGTTGCTAEVDPPWAIPYVGLAFGYAFDF